MIAIKTPYYLVKIIKSFLQNRSFSVKIGQELSDPMPAFSGVPQGGVLSPTLFSVFMNDIVFFPILREKNKSFSVLFGDDLATSMIFKNIDEVKSRIRNYLKDLESWSNKWRLSFAPPKSNILFSQEKEDQPKFTLK